MFDLSILNDAIPKDIPSTEDMQPAVALKDIVQDGLNNLVAVEELDDSEHDVPSAESMNVSIEAIIEEESNSSMMTNGVRKALQKLQKATGLNFDQPQPKPPPTIMIEGGVCRAFLQGCCYLTLAPLVHLLLNATEEDKFAIEMDAPHLGPHDFITLASAMEHSKANVYVGVRRIHCIFVMMVLESADEIHIAPNVHTVGSMNAFAMGSALDMTTTSEAFTDHAEYVHGILLDKNFLTEDELQEITEKGKSVRFTTEELLSRITGS